MKILISKRAKIILIVAIVLMITSILVVYNWIINPQFRLKFNLIFNCIDTHTSYIVVDDGEEYTIMIELPPSTTFEHKHSDTAATYYSRLSYDEFLQYYIDNGYQVEKGKVYVNDGIFIMSDESKKREEGYKYSFIDIDLLTYFSNP